MVDLDQYDYYRIIQHLRAGWFLRMRHAQFCWLFTARCMRVLWSVCRDSIVGHAVLYKSQCGAAVASIMTDEGCAAGKSIYRVELEW